jgi:hypothetical protein
MSGTRRAAAAAVLVAACAAVAAGAPTTGGAHGATAAPAGCKLANGIEHVVYLQFDNTHYRRDRPGIASDLEHMPHLLDFLRSRGTLFTNDHTILISHTAGGILSSLTGLYPDRTGQTVTNSYGYFAPNGSVGFAGAFKYWTDPVDPTFDPLPNMVTRGQKTAPAPWVPFTRAGCDVGGVGAPNIALENASAKDGGDVTNVFGKGSPEWNEAVADPHRAQADFVGIVVHCSQSPSSRCAGSADATDDRLPDEPGGYSGFEALFGAKAVDPAIAGGAPCVDDTAGHPVADPAGNCGFPGFDGMLAKNTLGYVEQMQEHGVPVTFAYISDAHDVHTPDPVADTYHSTAAGPGEAGFVAQLKAYDDAFAAFFSNLAEHGITRANTLFVVTVDEGDHFVGGAGTPQPDGTLAYAHADCSTLTACPSNQIGAVDVNLTGLLPADEPPFAVHSDDAPTVYVNGRPPRTDPRVRKLEQDIGELRLRDPYAGREVPVTFAMADPVEEATLHMVNADPARTPTFTLFGADDFFFTAGSDPPCGANPCVSPGFAWNHGDAQDEIGNTWAAIVGPGVATRGVDAKTWTDHVNLRPTILALTGLRDDYVGDGRVLVEGLEPAAVPKALARSKDALALSRLYEQLNAPFGRFATDTLAGSTKALVGTDAAAYDRTESTIGSLTARREVVAGKIKTALQRAAFSGRTIPHGQAKAWLAAGRRLLSAAAALR